MPSLKESLDLADTLKALVRSELIDKADANAQFLKHSGINLYPIKKERKRHGKRKRTV